MKDETRHLIVGAAELPVVFCFVWALNCHGARTGTHLAVLWIQHVANPLAAAGALVVVNFIPLVVVPVSGPPVHVKPPEYRTRPCAIPLP